MKNNVNTVVSMGLSELIELDLEGFLDLLGKLVLADLEEEERYNYALTDITYRLASGYCSGDSIPIVVSGYLEEMK